MASLTGTKIKNTYDGLLKTTDNEPLDGTLRTITDGLGNNSSLSLSTGAASVGGTLSVSGISTFDNKVGIGSSSFEAFDVLHISGTNAGANDLTFLGPSTSQVRIKFGAPSSLDGEIAYDNDAKSMKFKTNSSERLLLNSSGASVTGDLSVSSDITMSGSLISDLNVGSKLYFPSNTSFVLSVNSNAKIVASTDAVSLYGVITLDGTVLIDGDTWTNGKIMHRDDLNTYIDFPSNDNISLVTGGTQRLLVNNAGAMITGGLDVSGAYSSTNGRISLTNGDIEVGGGISIANSLSLASFSPNANLLVIGDTGAPANQGMTIVSPTGATGNIYFADGTTGDAEYRGSVTYNHNVDTLYLGAAAANKVAIDANGASVTGTLAVSGNLTVDTNTLYVDAASNRVGIGTNTIPFDGLRVNGASSTYLNITSGDGSSAGILLGGQTDTFDGGIVYDNPTQSMLFYSADAERMRIDSSGNVGIGGTASDKLTIVNGQVRLTDNYGIRWGDASVGVYGSGADETITLVTSSTERMRITSGGDLCVGKQSSNWSLNGLQTEVNGTSIGVTNSDLSNNFFLRKNGITGNIAAFYYDSVAVGTISITSSSTAYNTSSDYRLKEDWIPMEGALDRVDALKPINFAWKSSGDRVDGFLAHEVAEVVPEAVTGEKDATEIRSVEVSPAVYEDVVHPAEEAVYDEIIHEAVEAVYETIEHPAIAEELDEEGNVLVEAQEAWTEQILISEGQEEWIERVLVSEAKEEWVEKVLVSEAVFEDQEFPVYQGIDQSKIVPLLVAGLQEAHDLIKSLQARIEALEA
jgi:hypothetical protein